MKLLLDIEMDGLDEPLTFEHAKEFADEMLNSTAVYVEISNGKELEEKIERMTQLIKYLYIYRTWGPSMRSKVEEVLGEEIDEDEEIELF